MTPIQVKLGGKTVFLESDGDSSLRDINGKRVSHRAKDDGGTKRLSTMAGEWLNGRPVLMDLGPGDVASQGTVADFGVPALDAIADTVSAVRFVAHDRGTWYPQDPTNAVKLPLPDAVNGGAPPELNPGFSPVSFVTTGYGLSARIPRQVESNADFDLVARTTWTLINSLRLAREYRVATMLMTSTNYASANRIAAATKWNGVSPTPLVDLFGALKTSFLPADTMIVSEQVAPYLHTNALQTFKQAGGELPRILTARARYLSGAVPTYAWSPTTTVNVPLVRATGKDTELQTSVTLRWLGESGRASEDRKDGVLVRRFWSNDDNATWVVVVHNDSEVIVSSAGNVGALITGALA